MPPSEKELFLKALEREVQTTARVLRAYPDDKCDLCADNKRRAKDIAFMFVGEQAVADMAMSGNIDFSGDFTPPNSMTEILGMFTGMYQQNVEKIRSLSETQYNAPVKFPLGPGKAKEMRTADVLWMVLYDMVHHRGQLSVYLALAGGKVPSIYGPSRDETENVYLM